MAGQVDFTQFNKLTAARTKAFLANDGFAGKGSKRFEPSDLKLDALEEVLLQYGKLFSTGFADELAKQDKNASGYGTDSIRFEFEKLQKRYEVSIFMAKYLAYVDEGVQGVDKSKSINSTSRFKFKFINPSKSHVAALEKWITQKNVTAIITVPKGIKSELKPKSLATVIGMAIKKRGLKATYFKKKTVDNLINDFKADVAKAVGIDIKVNIIF